MIYPPVRDTALHQTKRIPFGIKIIIGFHLLSVLLWAIGQGGAVVCYDLVAEWGLQEPRESLDPVLVEVHRGIGLADVVVQTPLFLVAVAGLWRMKFYGAVASWLVLGISIYWPVVEWAKHFFFARAEVKYLPMDMATNGVLAFVVLFSVWASAYLFKKRELFD